jgi:amphi-Trp domain-containing protein
MSDALDDTEENIGKLEALVAAIRDGQPFVIEVDGERVKVPAHAEIAIDYDHDDGENALEIQFYWEGALDGVEDDADEDFEEEDAVDE